MTDKITVAIKEFTLKKSSEALLDRSNEPYIISIAIDQDGAQNANLSVNVKPFPNVLKGDTVSFDGQGHLIYGPKNPGEFLVYAILFMESDRDLRKFGLDMREIINSEASQLAMKTLMMAQPSYATAMALLEKLCRLVSKKLQQNKDDELYLRTGTLLRDVVPAYDILRTYKGGNQYINCHTAIIPLKISNKLGEQVKTMILWKTDEKQGSRRLTITNLRHFEGSMLNKLQKKATQAIINIFETGKVLGEYDRVTLLAGDPGHLTYGRSQTTLASGNLHLLIKAYCENDLAEYGAELTSYLERLADCYLGLDTNMVC